MTSYSQNREDVLLARVFADVPAGFYVDVGACDPDHASITRHFYEAGWRGINVEPGAVFDKLPPARPRDVNLNVAASSVAGTLAFTEFPAGPALGAVNPAMTEPMKAFAAGSYQRTVESRPLRDILAEHAANQVIDFLSIDVEGHEREVILGNDWARFRPRVCVVEATAPMEPTPTHERWEPLLLAAGYAFAYFDGLNRYYVRSEDEPLIARFAVPVNVFDDFTPREVVDLSKQVADLDGRLNALLVELDRERQATAQLRHDLDVATRERAEADRQRDEARALVARYRALCRNANGRPLSLGLWLARQGTAVRHVFTAGDDKPKWPV